MVNLSARNTTTSTAFKPHLTEEVVRHVQMDLLSSTEYVFQSQVKAHAPEIHVYARDISLTMFVMEFSCRIAYKLQIGYIAIYVITGSINREEYV